MHYSILAVVWDTARKLCVTLLASFLWLKVFWMLQDAQLGGGGAGWW